MKRGVLCWMLGVVGILLIGCEYSVPLVEQPGMEIDPALIGVWERTSRSGPDERLLVLPLDETEYLVSLSAGEHTIYARACLAEVAGTTLVQVRWIGTGKGELPGEHPAYQFAVYSIEGETLTLRRLNTQVVDATLRSSSELAGAVAEQINHPDLFAHEMVLERRSEVTEL